MAKLRKDGFSYDASRYIIRKNPKVYEIKSLKKMDFRQLKKKGVYLRHDADTDKDGVINIKDCRPLDPKKQGFLHDLQIKRLRKKEEQLEKKREKEMAKLEDLKDTLKEKTNVSKKKTSIKKIQMAQKQAIIDEINKEKKAAAELKIASRKAKEQLDRITVTGKAKTALKKAAAKGVIITGKGAKAAAGASVRAAQAANNFLNKDSTKKTIRNTTRRIYNAIFVDKKKNRLKLEK